MTRVLDYEDEAVPAAEEPKPEEDEKPTALEAKAAQDEQDEAGAIPRWAEPYIPQDLRVPLGRQVAFMRFKSKWTDAPMKGVETEWPMMLEKGAKTEMCLTRVLMVWTLSDAEERLAYKRSRGEVGRPQQELAMQMMRAVDGMRVDWSGEWANKDRNEDLIHAPQLWTQLGSKCRAAVVASYLKLHTLDMKEQADFFLNGFVAVSAVGG